MDYKLVRNITTDMDFPLEMYSKDSLANWIFPTKVLNMVRKHTMTVLFQTLYN